MKFLPRFTVSCQCESYYNWRRTPLVPSFYSSLEVTSPPYQSLDRIVGATSITQVILSLFVYLFFVCVCLWWVQGEEPYFVGDDENELTIVPWVVRGLVRFQVDKLFVRHPWTIRGILYGQSQSPYISGSIRELFTFMEYYSVCGDSERTKTSRYQFVPGLVSLDV